MKELGTEGTESSASRWELILREEGLWLGILIAVHLALALPVVSFGRLTADEGWYLLASMNVADGQQPYRDFLFTQTPLLPYVYAVALSVVGPTLVAARFVSMLFGLGGLLFAMAAIRRRVGPFATLLGGTVVVLNLAVTFDVSVLKTQSLTFLLTGLAIWLASGSGRWFQIVGSIAAMTLAVLSRLSMLPALLCFYLYWLARPGRQRAIAVVTAVASAAILAAGAWFFWADGNAWFGVYEFHRAYFAGMPTEGKFGWFFFKGWLANQMPVVLAGLVALALLIWRLARSGAASSPWASDLRLLLLLLASYLGTTALHATRTVTYPTYQTSNALFLVVFASLVLGPLVGSSPRARVAALVAALLIGLLGMPLQEYVVNRQGVAAPGKVAEAVSKLSRLPWGNGRILTLAPELALGAHRKLLPGYEMGSFSYFPGLDDVRAKQLRVVNAAQLERDLVERRASILGLTASALYGFTRGIEYPRLRQLIDSRYDLVGTVKGYGQYAEVLYLFLAKDASDTKSSRTQ